MNSWIELISKPMPDAHFTALFLDSLIKSFVVLALAAGTCAAWRRASAATRHLIWFLALASLPCLPLLTSSLPSGRNTLWSVSTVYNSGNQISLGLTFASGENLMTSAANPPASPTVAQRNNVIQKPTETRRKLSAHFGTNWLALGLFVWAGGAALVLLSVAAGQLRLHRLAGRARRLQNSEWTAQLLEARETLRLRRTVTLWQSADNVMPLTWGWWRPVILLPAEAENWPDDRQRIVLLHELAHIKRWDCLTQFSAKIICAFYWFNPLVWLAARRMCIERERACDDLVLNAGCKASDYADLLVEIAGSFRRAPRVAAIAMARPSGLEQRVEAILDVRRNRNRVAKLAVGFVVVCFFSLGWLIGSSTAQNSPQPWTLKNSAVGEQLKAFVAEKEAQEKTLIKTDEVDFAKFYANTGDTLMVPDCRPFFTAAAEGDWQTMSNLWSELEKHTFGQTKSTNGYPHGLWSQPMRETYGAIEAFVVGDEKYSKLFGDEVIQSIPAGSIYFGGTDPGRFIVTALQKSEVDDRILIGGTFTNLNGTSANNIVRLNSDGTLDKAFPRRIYTLTQNALADGTYLNYLRSMYGNEIYIPTAEDSRNCFMDYVADARVRYQNHQLKPGEDFKEETNGGIQVSGVVAVMQINGLLVKTIFDKNPGREFYIEQSWPLDWMYPNLEPHGLIFKINRQPLPELSDEIVQRDHDYWTKTLQPMIGGWLNDDTPLASVTAFAEKVFLRHDFTGFTGDPAFVQNEYSCKMFSKLRSSIAGLYVWRMDHATSADEKERMARAADFAFRQALALCPYNSETVQNYLDFLKAQDRISDAILVTEIAAQFPSAPKPDSAESAGSESTPAKPPVFQMRLVLDAPGPDAEPLPYPELRPDGGFNVKWLEVQKTVLLDQTAIQSATLGKNGLGKPIIDIALTDAGREQFAEISRQNIGKRLAVVIDGQIRCAPVIESEITHGKMQIAGSFGEPEAKNLAAEISAAIAK